ncbi:MAG TPA: WhiB family transcriptional regulator [Propionibacterium sp.]|jgi:WhiB family redox-sensing transcriptional regulator|nr:WhiB family transcriptional regulator [Propionibacterium sp.]
MTATLLDEDLMPASLPCHRVDPEVFFAEAPAQVEFAKTLCVDCPVREECLSGALARREACGVWGGQLIVNGEIVARKRPRGRPRKNPLPVLPVPPPELGAPVRRVAPRVANERGARRAA